LNNELKHCIDEAEQPVSVCCLNIYTTFHMDFVATKDARRLGQYYFNFSISWKNLHRKNCL